MYKAKFRTAYLQREVVMDAIVVGNDALEVGELAVVSSYGENPVIVEAVTANDVPTALTEATHIMAQSDTTMEYGHVPVEYRDYKYSDEIKVSVAALANFKGFYANAAALAGISQPATGDTALVFVSDGVYEKYAYGSNAWADANVKVNTKKIAAFKIINEDDVIAYDVEA